MMHPNRNPLLIWNQILQQPISNSQELFSIRRFSVSKPQVVIPESVLSNRDGIILRTNGAPIIQHRNAYTVENPPVLRLADEWHVVFAQFPNSDIGVHLRHLVPE